MTSISPKKFPFKDLPNQSTNQDSQFSFFNSPYTQRCKEELCSDISGCYQGQL